MNPYEGLIKIFLKVPDTHQYLRYPIPIYTHQSWHGRLFKYPTVANATKASLEVVELLTRVERHVIYIAQFLTLERFLFRLYELSFRCHGILGHQNNFYPEEVTVSI